MDSFRCFSVECVSGSLQIFDVVVRDEGGKTVWTMREEPRGGILRYTKFRLMLPLVLTLRGRGKRCRIERSAGLWKSHYQVEQEGKGILFRVVQGFARWRLEDEGGDPLGELSFSNPFLIGRDRAVLKDSRGEEMAEVELRSMGFFTSRWEGRIVLTARGADWEVPAVVAAGLRLAGKQGR
jgi:hypothetical protein